MTTTPASIAVERKADRTRQRLGELLLLEGLISQQMLDTALAESIATGVQLGRVLVRSGAIGEDDLAQALSRQLAIVFVNLNRFAFRPEVVWLLSETDARRLRAVVLEDQGARLLVGLADPSDFHALDELERILKRDIALAACSESQMLAAFDRVYAPLADTASQAAKAKSSRKVSEPIEQKAAQPRMRLGDLLLSEGLITQQVLDSALAESTATGKRLGRVLVDNGAIREDKLALVLSRQLDIQFINLNRFTFDPEVVKLLPEAAARRFRAVILADHGDSLRVALADASDANTKDELERFLRRNITLAACSESHLLAAFDRLYRRTDEISGHARALEKDIGSGVDFGQLLGSNAPGDAPVMRLLQSLFEDAIQVRASDIHIEPQEHSLQIRFRVDDMLLPQTKADVRIAGALAQRMKLMAGLDISERRLPLDGRFSIKVRQREIDVRLSTLPGQHGESIVLRLLDQSGAVRNLDAVGMPALMLERMRHIITGGSGMVLVTGPTGSGKTTTLYAALAEVDVASQKVITVEDPVEYRLPGIVQVQVNEKIELTFARVLRATLRQDPDVVLVGEMRDMETAEIGLRAALTGHMVLSTLHTRDAPSTLFRLFDMGCPPYMVATSLRAVLAQRLLRLNCGSCSQMHISSAQEQAWLIAIGGEAAALTQSYRGVGCSHCNNTGYRGRTGVFEMLVMDSVLTEAAVNSDPARFMVLARERMQGGTLADHALALVRERRTSIAEAMRIASMDDD